MADAKSLNRLKNHLEMMKKELGHTTAQIKQLEKSDKERSNWDNLDTIKGTSISELREHQSQLVEEISKVQREIKKSRSKSLLVAELVVLPAVFLLIVFSGVFDMLGDAPNSSPILKTRYLTENLRGDTIDTWKSWRLVGNTLDVNILKSPRVTDHQLQIIRDAISSDKVVQFDDYLVHKGLKGSKSTYYEGWAGALKSVQEQTKYNLPNNFNFISTPGGEGDIIITLSNVKDSDGYTGYTKSIIEENEILKSFITIYDISNLTDEQLATIVRHEFGHALGLGHSTAPEDLMAPTIDMTIPYITECNVAAVIDLYNGNEEARTVCEK